MVTDLKPVVLVPETYTPHFSLNLPPKFGSILQFFE